MSSPGFGFALSCTGCTVPTFLFTLHATNCSTAAYPGVTVAVSGVGSATTNGSGDAVISLAAGTYTVTCTDPNGIVIVFTLTMPSANTTVTKNFITTMGASVTNSCGGAGLSGASVSFAQGATLLGTCTSSGGSCSITLTTAVSTSSVVTVTVTYKGTSTTCTFTPNAACTNTCSVQFKDTITVTVTGCNSLSLPGASVSISPGAATGTTNGSGVATVTPSTGILPGTSVTATVSKSRFTTDTVTFSGCTASKGLSPTASYICIPGCADPLALTLNGTDPLGSFTLTYDAGQSLWVDCQRRNAPFVRVRGSCATTSSLPDTPVQFIFTGSRLCIGYTYCSSGVGSEADDACNTTANTFPFGLNSCAPAQPIISENLTCPTSFAYDITYAFVQHAVGGGVNSTALIHIYGTGHSLFSLTE